MFALVDDEDFDFINQWKWRAMNGKGLTFYAVRTVWPLKGESFKKYNILMHRQILGLTKRDEQADHIDNNGLNNQRSNLRIATSSQNQSNRKAQQNGTSGYKGVSWCARDKRWVAQICLLGKRKHIGNFKNKLDAAIAYNIEANRLHKEFAYINKV